MAKSFASRFLVEPGTRAHLNRRKPDDLKAFPDREAAEKQSIKDGEAIERVEKSVMTSLVITDTIMTTDAVKASKNIRVVSVAPLLAEAVKRISDETSVSSLFD